MARSKLKTEIHTPAMGERIELAYKALRGTDGEAFFEHGQWWISDGDFTYSVCDAIGAPDHVCDGFSFEEV